MNDSVKIFKPQYVKTTRGLVVPLWGDDNGEIGAVEFEVAGSGIEAGGQVFSTSTLVETITADVQPKSLTQYQLQAWGISEYIPNTKIMFYFGDGTNLINGNRVLVNGTDRYDIKATNLWTSHIEVLLCPVVGVA